MMAWICYTNKSPARTVLQQAFDSLEASSLMNKLEEHSQQIFVIV